MPRTMVRRDFVFLLFLLSCFSIVCCALPALAARSGQGAPPITVEKTSPEFSWTLQTPGNAGMVQVILSLRDAKGAPALGKNLTGEVWMPEMPMQGYPLELNFFELQNGDYGALVQYAHGGLWQIKAAFTGEDGRRHGETFDFTLSD